MICLHRSFVASLFAEMPFEGLGGVALGDRTLYVVTVSSLVNITVPSVIGDTNVDSSLYEITELNAKGCCRSARLVL